MEGDLDIANPRRLTHSGDGLEEPDFGDLCLERGLDSEGESHDRGRAALTGADQPDLNDPVGVDPDDLDIAAVGPEAGADVFIEHGLDPALEIGVLGCGS
jgi:hypothetical protein